MKHGMAASYAGATEEPVPRMPTGADITAYQREEPSRAAEGIAAE